MGMHVEQLLKAIKAHIAKADHAKDKAEQHYTSAGQHLKTLKAQHDAHGGNWAEWSELLRSRCDLSTGRASELMQIADGRTSQQKIRAKDKDRKKLTRSKKPSSGHPEEDNLPGPTTEPDRAPATNPLVVLWATAGREERREFVHACWDEIVRARDHVGQPSPMAMQARTTGLTSLRKMRKRLTAGSRATDDNTARGTTRKNPRSSGEDP